MSIDRRTFIAAGLAAAAAPLSHSRAAGQGQGGGTLTFEMTGLFAIELWRTSKKMKVLLIDDPGNSKHPPHAPLLMMRLADYDAVNSTYLRPQILYLNEPVAIWPLNSRAVWVGDVQSSYDTDPSPTLKLSDSARPFVDLGIVLKKPKVEVKMRKLATGQVLLTRGTATPHLPVAGSCEDQVEYEFVKNGTVVVNKTKYSSQLTVKHPAAAALVKLMITKTVQGEPVPSETWVISVKVPAGGDTMVNVSNATLASVPGMHFPVFYKVINHTNGPDLKPTVPCQLLQPTLKAHPTDMRQGQHPSSQIAPEAPYVGCIPPVIPED